MKKQSILKLILLLVALFVFQGCSSGGGTDKPGPAETGLVLTLEELAQHDGKDGNPAYIAIDGVIYDVSKVPQWKNGEHNGFVAGKDLSNEIKTISPHGVSKLKSVPVVGKLEQ